jgi:hypothetical protein
VLQLCRRQLTRCDGEGCGRTALLLCPTHRNAANDENYHRDLPRNLPHPKFLLAGFSKLFASIQAHRHGIGGSFHGLLE